MNNRLFSSQNLVIINNFLDIKNLQPDTNIAFNAFLHKTRIKGKVAFLVFRSELFTVQGVYFNNDNNLLTLINSLTNESFLNVEATIQNTSKPIDSCTIKNKEIQIKNIKIISPCISVLPFQMEDACRKSISCEEDSIEGLEKSEKEKDKKAIIVKTNTRLDNRVLDLRVPTNQALMRLKSEVLFSFRNYLRTKGFVEINTPKLIKSTSEGGAAVFKVKYFDDDVFLAQSPQLYKQMSIISGFKRVYEIGSVFRAENSNSLRHMCEFTMLDLEMEIKEHYEEIIELSFNLLISIFEHIKQNCKDELETINSQYQFDNLSYDINKPFIITYKEAVDIINEEINILNKNNIDKLPLQNSKEDLSTYSEKILGQVIKRLYNTDLYFVKGYPKNARPFYTMIDSNNKDYTYSFDGFLRGEEILSGSRRINNYNELIKSVNDNNIPQDGLNDYLNSFRLGAPNHGGVGIGLERIVKLLVNFDNVKRCSMFPRDPKRISP